MRALLLLLAAAVGGLLLSDLPLASGQRLNSFQWLNQLRSRRRHPQAQWNNDGGLQGEKAVDCPLECDCPSYFPTAMYCHGRALQHVPYVPSHVKYVYLQRNNIQGIPDGVFDNATSLVWVVLFHNKLESDKIGKRVFAKLRNLDRLYLDHNELSRVPAQLPASITDLRLSHNRITKVGAGAFDGMAQLASLKLHVNAIEEVAPDALKALGSLSTLDLRKNKLKRIPENLPARLSQLYLEFNDIESVPADFFARYPRLQFVRLAHNRLTDRGIPSQVFNVSTLVELDLSHNKLQKIPTVARSLENLYLQANQIKEFSVGSFCSVVDMANFSKLRVLRLDANEISVKDIPDEAAYCLRMASSIDV